MAVLSQVQEGEARARPIAFASNSLSQSQKNYPAHRLEFLALKWFSHWPKGHKFTVWTDNNPLTHILTKPKLDCCEQRWVAKLASYNVHTKYVPGQQNVVADALSRTPFVKESVGRRLLAEPYASLLAEVRNVSIDSVQNALRSSSGHKITSPVSDIARSSCSPLIMQAQSVALEDASAVLQSHIEWDAGPRACAVAVLPFLPHLVQPGRHTLPVYSERDLREKIDVSLVSCSMLRGVGNLQEERDLKSLSVSHGTLSTGTGSLCLMVCCTGFQETRKPERNASNISSPTH